MFKMPSKRLHRNKKFLEYYLEADKSRRRSLLLGAKKDQIDCLCEATLNVLNTNVSVPSKVRDQLCKHKKSLTKLAFHKEGLKNRKKILVQKGGAFLPLILGTILPLLAQAIFPSSS